MPQARMIFLRALILLTCVFFLVARPVATYGSKFVDSKALDVVVCVDGVRNVIHVVWLHSVSHHLRLEKLPEAVNSQVIHSTVSLLNQICFHIEVMHYFPYLLRGYAEWFMSGFVSNQR
jgi:hypothetical protein